ncbi:MAG: lipid-A-disaccharide synthase [Gammaproteobacteria bacterium]|nr:lipid-A-disaccharide synthase [Gammaproteobacteria bacterium]
MNIVIVAGEVSGDLLAGKLVTGLKNLDNQLCISGIGGQSMRDAGVNTLFDVRETSVVGITEILKHYPRLHKILSTLKKHIRQTKPELLILVDYPEFNLKLAQYAKKLNIKVVFYVSPQVWAWRTGRIEKIKNCVDLMAVLFPFELDFYQNAGVPACLVRHPLLDDIDNAYKSTDITPEKITVIGMLPGSRENEIKKLLPVMIEAGHKLLNQNPNMRFILPAAPGTDINELKTFNKNNLPIDYQQDSFYQSLQQCQALMIASGTATLQAALMGKAMVVIYKISPITYKLFGHMVNVEHICLANIILNRRAYKELIQDDANADNLFDSLTELINDNKTSEKMINNREEIRNNLNAGITSNELAIRALALTKQT